MSFGREVLARTVGIVVLGGVAFAATLFATSSKVSAQIHNGEFDFFQPHQSAMVGRVWCNSDRTTEYWAYIEGQYEWAGSGHVSGNRWDLDAQYVGNATYASFQAFKDAVLALPQTDGKTVTFQKHTIINETIIN